MTEELKQAAQAALEQLEFLNACYPHKTAADAVDALRRALTQRPAAQEVATVTLSSAIEAIEHVSAHNGPGREDEAIAMLRLVNDPAMRDRLSRTAIPAAHQATKEPR